MVKYLLNYEINNNTINKSERQTSWKLNSLFKDISLRGQKYSGFLSLGCNNLNGEIYWR